MEVLLIFCVFLPAKSQYYIPVLRTDSIKYYDSFGDEVGASYTGGYVEVACEPGPARQICGAESVNLIDPEENIVASTSCTDRVVFRLGINQQIRFGHYRCEHKGSKSVDMLDFQYRFCADNEDMCMRDQSNSHPIMYCIVTSNGTQFWTKEPYNAKFNLTWCVKETGVTYCPAQQSSFCESFVSGLEVQAQINGDASCLESGIEHFPRVVIASGVEYNDAFPAFTLHASGILSITFVNIKCYECKSCGPKRMRVTCGMKMANGTTVGTQVFDNCRPMSLQIYRLNHSILYDNGFQLLKLVCIFDNYSTILSRTSHYIVTIGAPIVTKLEATDKRYTERLYCQTDQAPPLPYNVTYYWSKKCIPTDRIQEGPVLNISNADNISYCCMREVVYRRCAPSRLLPLRMRSLENYAIAKPTTTTLAFTRTSNPVITTSSKTSRQASLTENALRLMGITGTSICFGYLGRFGE